MIKVHTFSTQGTIIQQAASQSASNHQSKSSVLKKTQKDSQWNLRYYLITHSIRAGNVTSRSFHCVHNREATETWYANIFVWLAI